MNFNWFYNWGRVHIISHRFSFRFTELYGMMWTHFLLYIYVEYEFKNFEHYFNVFWWKKQPSEKKKYKRKFSNSSNKKMSTDSKIDFFLTEEIQFLIYRLIQILVVAVVVSHFKYNLHFKDSKCMNSIKWIHKNYNYNVFFTAHFVTLTKNSYLY